MNRSFLAFVLSLLFFYCGSTFALKGPRGQRTGLRRLQDDEPVVKPTDDGEGAGKEGKKDSKDGKDAKDGKKSKKESKKSKKEKDKKCKKAKKDSEETEVAEDPLEEEGDADLPYCEGEGDHCDAIKEGKVLDSDNTLSGTIRLKVAHSEDSDGQLVSKFTRLLQNETSSRIAGCHVTDEDEEVPTDLSVSRAESSEGKKILQANFYNMAVEDGNVRCKSRSEDNCDTLTTDVDVIYESSDGSRVTKEEASAMMRSVEEAILEQEDLGVFRGVSASVEAVSSDYDEDDVGSSSTADAEPSKRGGFSPGIAIGVVVAGIGCVLAAVAYNKMQHRNRGDVGETNEKGGSWLPNVLAMPSTIKRESS